MDKLEKFIYWYQLIVSVIGIILMITLSFFYDFPILFLLLFLIIPTIGIYASYTYKKNQKLAHTLTKIWLLAQVPYLKFGTEAVNFIFLSFYLGPRTQLEICWQECTILFEYLQNFGLMFIFGITIPISVFISIGINIVPLLLWYFYRKSIKNNS